MEDIRCCRRQRALRQVPATARLNGMEDDAPRRYANYLDGVVPRNDPEPEPASLSRAWLEPPKQGGLWTVTIELGGRAESHTAAYSDLVTIARDAGIDEIYVWDVDHSHYEPLDR
jgi:hypothetical protein